MTTQSAPRMDARKRLVLGIAILASFVSFLDATVVNVALRAIGSELGGGLATQQWVVDGYLVTLGALILLAGSISDAYGRVMVLRIGLVGFGIASVACGAALGPEMLIVARLVQGIAGALLVPSSLALITSTFDGQEESRAIGIWTGATTAATVAGPLLGGLFVDLLTWRLVFFINVIPIAVTLVLLHRLGPADERTADARIPWLDAALCAVGLGAFVLALIEEPSLGWADPRIWIPLVSGVVLFAVFVLRQRSESHPMLPLALFRVRNFWSGNIATLFIYGSLSLVSFVISIYLQQGAGLPATVAGASMLPATAIMIVLSSRIGALSGRWGPRLFMTVGPFVMAGGILLLLLVRPRGAFDYAWQVLPGILVFGFGLTLTVSPLTAAILGSIEKARSGVASAVNNAVSRVGGLIVIAVIAQIAGGSLDLAGFQRTLVVGALLMAAGGAVSFLGIRNDGSRGSPGTSPAD